LGVGSRADQRSVAAPHPRVRVQFRHVCAWFRGGSGQHSNPGEFSCLSFLCPSHRAELPKARVTAEGSGPGPERREKAVTSRAPSWSGNPKIPRVLGVLGVLGG
jgi:hypothetical protein